MAHYTVYTAGHGEEGFDSFAARVRPFGVEIIADVRHYPYNPAAPDFNRDRLEQLARREGWEYVWLGLPLGALTESGRVDFIAKEREGRYRSGIQELLGLAHDRIVCLLDGQADLDASPRHQLIAQTLLRQHVEVRHILDSGASVPAQADLFHVGMA